MENTNEDIRTLFPIYDRGDEPLVTVEQLKRDLEEVIGSGSELPYLAFVSGPEMNFRVEFNDYDAELHRGIVAHGLMELIRLGADHIVLVAEVWFRNEEKIPTWHSVMILDARPDGDTTHFAGLQRRPAPSLLVASRRRWCARRKVRRSARVRRTVAERNVSVEAHQLLPASGPALRSM